MATAESGKSLIGIVDIDDARSNIERDGFSIARGVVTRDSIDRMCRTWLAIYRGNISHAPVIWGPFLGEPNRILFHRSDTHCMYRAYDFLWNPPVDHLTRDIGLGLNRVRNEIAGNDPFVGEILQSDRYGIYLTTSYYPPGTGWMAKHADRSDSRRHWHYMLQLTHKGSSYTEGGLYVVARSGEKVDVDSQVNPGDVIFFDGACTHGVEIVRGGAGLGRLQMFSIPTFMDMPQQNNRMLEEISIARFVKAKLRPLKRRFTGGESNDGGA